MWWHTPSVSALRKQKLRNICALKVSLFYVEFEVKQPYKELVRRGKGGGGGEGGGEGKGEGRGGDGDGGGGEEKAVKGT